MKPTRPDVRTARHAALEIQSVSGPDCSPPLALGLGRHLIGRSPGCCIHVDDPTVELHHAMLLIDVIGAASVRQLTGRRTMQITDAVGSETPPGRDGAIALGVRSNIVLGTTELRVTVGGSTAPAAHVPLSGAADEPPELAEILRQLVHDPGPTSRTAPNLGWSVALGVGDVPVHAQICEGPSDLLTTTASRRAVVPWTPEPGTVTWLRGPRTACRALARSILVQLAIAHPPSAWSLAIDTDHPIDWTWAAALPHHRADRPPDHTTRSVRIVDCDEQPRPAAFAQSRAAVIALGDSQVDRDGAVLQIGSTGRARWMCDPVDRWFTMTGIGSSRAAELARPVDVVGRSTPCRCRHGIGESPRSQRGPDPKLDAASSVL